MNAYLVDDEPLALKRLSRMLEDVGGVSIAGTSSDPVEAVAAIGQIKPEVLFLDIEMPALSGFDLLAKLGYDPLVVFTTAYDQYALRAFEVNSIDYLLKPVEAEPLRRALAKVDRMLGGQERRTNVRTLAAEVAHELARREPRYLERLPSRVGDKVEFLEVAAVTHFYAKDKVTFAATAQKHYIIDQTIADLEQRLDPRRFVRIHRSTIVSADAIKELYNWFAGKMLVRLKDGKTELGVARDRVAELKSRLGF
jgi:two-component system LytT family response regulator